MLSVNHAKRAGRGQQVVMTRRISQDKFHTANCTEYTIKVEILYTVQYRIEYGFVT
jgi:hypothetical protein